MECLSVVDKNNKLALQVASLVGRAKRPPLKIRGKVALRSQNSSAFDRNNDVNRNRSAGHNCAVVTHDRSTLSNERQP